MDKRREGRAKRPSDEAAPADGTSSPPGSGDTAQPGPEPVLRGSTGGAAESGRNSAHSAEETRDGT